ncbi:MAG: hypothetical protein ACE5HY_03585 [Candidatus Hydrothermarchaeales archaeon]
MYFLIFFILDFMVIHYMLAPTSGAKTGEQWLPSELLEVGKNLDYEIKTYSTKYGLITSTPLYRISADTYNNVLIHGKLPETKAGTLGTSSKVSTESGSINIIKPERGLAGLMGGEEDFKVNKYSLMATETGSPSYAWNLYVYHPSLYSFLDNKLAMNNKWLYLSTDGYAYRVNVLGKDKDMYVIDIEYRTFEKDRMWVNTMYPTPVRLERYNKNDVLILSSALME